MGSARPCQCNSKRHQRCGLRTTASTEETQSTGFETIRTGSVLERIVFTLIWIPRRRARMSVQHGTVFAYNFKPDGTVNARE